MNTINKYSFINYGLNRLCPLLVTSCLLFWSLGFNNFVPYIVIGLSMFAEKFNFKVGYSVALCEERGLLKKNEK